MSLASKITLASSIVLAVGTISYVHFKQYSDREQLHQGVLKDVERRQRRKAENIYILEKQIELTKELKRSDSNSEDVT